jgi:uncharacterized membrane protein YbhN (UPF0104 family)
MVGDLLIEPRSRRQPRWRLAVGIAMSLGAMVLAYMNRQWLGEALGLARAARPLWLFIALAIILGSYFVSSQVFQVVLRSLGYRVNPVRLWAVALVAIVTSQSLPAGGVGSYAFLLRSFRKHGVLAGHAALVAALEALSYAGAMLIFAAFGLAYLASRALALDALTGPLLAGAVALTLVGGAAALLTRSQRTLTTWLLGVNQGLSRLRRRQLDGAWAHRAIGEVVHARALVMERRRLLAALVLIQLTGLSGHSLALYVILHSLGATGGAGVVFAAFGIALFTSTFNVLPGGGGTVEAVLVVTLTQLAAGVAAVPAAILFRLLNFWVMLPLAGACYGWLSRDRGTSRGLKHEH